VPQQPIATTASAVVDAPASAIFPHLADPTLRPAWMTELKRVDAAPGPVAVGDRFIGESSILLHDFIGASEVTEVDLDLALTESVVIGARFTSCWRLDETEPGRTTVHHSIDVEFPAGPFSWIERWVLRRRLLRMQQASLANLARSFVTPHASGRADAGISA